MTDMKEVRTRFAEELKGIPLPQFDEEKITHTYHRLCATRIEAHWAQIYKKTINKPNGTDKRQTLFVDLHEWATVHDADLRILLPVIRGQILDAVKA